MSACQPFLNYHTHWTLYSVIHINENLTSKLSMAQDIQSNANNLCDKFSQKGDKNPYTCMVIHGRIASPSVPVHGMHRVLVGYIKTGCIFCAPSGLRQGPVFDPQRHPPSK